MSRECFDILVIGSGPGGAVTAALAAESGRSTALVEEGRAQANVRPYSSQEIASSYRNGGLTAAFGRPRVQYGEAKCLGGGSEINAGLYYRTPEAMLERWAREFDLRESGAAEMAPHFSALEREFEVRESEPSEVSAILRTAAASLGWKAEAARCLADANGNRTSMTKVFLPRMARAGGKLFTETRALHLNRRAGEWRLITDQGELRAKNVFLAAGAIGTAALLRRSGIKRNVGNSLKFHPSVKVVARFPDKFTLRAAAPALQIREFGPALSLGGSVTTAPLLALDLGPSARSSLGADAEHLAIFYASCIPSGSGSVRNLPGFRDPLVRFQLKPADLDLLRDGASRLGELLFRAGASGIYPLGKHDLFCPSIEKYQKFVADRPVADWKISSVHVFSTCPMGENQDACAVDSFGRVHGQDGLFVADASLLCSAPGVNPQATIMAFARRNILRHLAGGSGC